MANLEISRAPRLDQKVVELLPDLSRANAAKLIEQGRVKVNAQIQTKPGIKLRADDVVVVDYDSKQATVIPEIDLEVIYEDDDCVVIYKPIGLLAHSKGAFNPEPTVASWLRSKVRGIDGNRAGIVHRLDRATSGVMICAKTPAALSWLQKQFAQRRTKKQYIALVQGHMKHDKAVIEMPIERNPKAPATFRVGPMGKPATTEFEVIRTSQHYSLLLLKPETGRTHQLRVHLAHLGHPIVGDELYKAKSADRLYLHALSLEVTIPQGHERKVFQSELPAEFMRKLDQDV